MICVSLESEFWHRYCLHGFIITLDTCHRLLGMVAHNERCSMMQKHQLIFSLSFKGEHAQQTQEVSFQTTVAVGKEVSLDGSKFLSSMLSDWCVWTFAQCANEDLFVLSYWISCFDIYDLPYWYQLIQPDTLNPNCLGNWHTSVAPTPPTVWCRSAQAHQALFRILNVLTHVAKLVHAGHDRGSGSCTCWIYCDSARVSPDKLFYSPDCLCLLVGYVVTNIGVHLQLSREGRFSLNICLAIQPLRADHTKCLSLHALDALLKLNICICLPAWLTDWRCTHTHTTNHHVQPPVNLNIWGE